MRRTFTFTVAMPLAGVLAFSAGALAAPQDLGDLIQLYRDANGVPYLTPENCWQPLPSATCTTDAPTCALVDSVPAGVSVIPVDPATCAVAAECALCTQEVDFGRINEARSPDAVFDSQLEDVVFNLATSDCVVTLDPAGRMVTSGGAIDSPLQNLAIYRQLLQTGSIGVPLAQGASVLDTAARGLGAASDKSGGVNVDMVVYLNQIMGLSDPATTTILDPKLCINMKEEVGGVPQLVQKCFLDYGAYGYLRVDNFADLPAPPYIPEGAAIAGYFEYLDVIMEEPLTFGIVEGPILDAVFGADTGFEGGNIGGFAQAADDARAVIDFMHTWPVPADYVTPVPCEPVTLITYDVSIPEQSGLQVPKQIVDGSEGREFIVTVANAGPDAASGTVTVTAEAANGVAIVGSPWTFVFNNLVSGASEAFTQLFTINLGARTTIAWTATVFAPNDVNLANNTRTATSTVKVTGGGGGGGRP